MNFDLQTTLLIIGAAIAVILLLWLLLRGLMGRRQSITQAEPELETTDPYAATKERPYMKPPSPAVEPSAPPVEPLSFHARDIRVDGVPVEAPPATTPEASDTPAPIPDEVPSPRDEPVAEAAPPPPPPPPEVAIPSPPIPGEFGGIAFPPGATDHQDELTRLKGVGPKLAALLNEAGITQYGQLAAMSDEDVAALDARMGNFKGRLTRDRVREQARLLASGDREGFEATFGKLGG